MKARTWESGWGILKGITRPSFGTCLASRPGWHNRITLCKICYGNSWETKVESKSRVLCCGALSLCLQTFLLFFASSHSAFCTIEDCDLWYPSLLQLTAHPAFYLIYSCFWGLGSHIYPSYVHHFVLGFADAVAQSHYGIYYVTPFCSSNFQGYYQRRGIQVRFEHLYIHLHTRASCSW